MPINPSNCNMADWRVRQKTAETTHQTHEVGGITDYLELVCLPNINVMST